MVAVATILGILVTPFALWIAGLETIAILIGIFVALCVPSIVYALYVAIKNRAWPKIVGGPGITWAGKHIDFWPLR